MAKNGLLSFGMDYGRFFKALEAAMKASGTEVPPDFQQFSGSTMKMALKMDVNQQGLVVNSELEMAQATK